MMSSKKRIKNFGATEWNVSETETPQEGTMTVPQNLSPEEEEIERDTSPITIQEKPTSVVALSGADLNCDLDARQSFL